jgi:hypothetical protein
MSDHMHPIRPLSSLEVSGAICARVIHDLSNLVSGILGNAEYAMNPDVDPAGLQKALQAISLSANNAGKILGQCLPLQQLIFRDAFPYGAGEQAADIGESACLAPGWQVIPPAALDGEIMVQSNWLTAAVWQFARETQSMGGEVEFACGPAVFPVVWSGPNLSGDKNVNLFQITLRYRADEPLYTESAKISAERFALLAAHEIIKRFRGQIHLRPKPPGRQEITILLPLTLSSAL